MALAAVEKADIGRRSGKGSIKERVWWEGEGEKCVRDDVDY